MIKKRFIYQLPVLLLMISAILCSSLGNTMYAADSDILIEITDFPDNESEEESESTDEETGQEEINQVIKKTIPAINVSGYLYCMHKFNIHHAIVGIETPPPERNI